MTKINLDTQVADGSINRLYTNTEKTKLTGVATGATLNAADATLLARANHTGTQSADTLTDGSTNKAFLATERTKLSGIATSATANAADATLLARANHTGTQTASTISDFSTAADARISAAAGSTIASLSAGKIPSSQIPAVGLVTVQTAASQAAQLALTAQEGDVVVRTDTSVTYMHNAGSAGTMADYTLLNSPSGGVSSVNGNTGVVVLGKTDVGLGNVDNTSDATKNSASVSLTNKNLTSGTNTFPTFNQNTTGTASSITGNITESQVTNLTTDLAAKAQALIPTAVKTANYTLAANEFVPVDTTSGSVTLTLPTAPPDGTRVGAKMVIQGGTNTITITRGGTDVFNKAGGSTSVTITLSLQSVQFQYAAGIWYGVAADIGLTALDARYQATSTNLTAFAAKTAPTGAVVGDTDTQTLTNKNLSSGTNTFPTFNQNTTGSAAKLTTARNINGVPFDGTADIVANKPRIGTTASSATPSINADSVDHYTITALAANITGVTVTGTPADGQKLTVRIKGTAARTITWGTSFQSSGTATLLATTSGTNTHMVGFIYDSAAAKWVCMAVDTTGY